jgi:hypothetical protein
VCGSLDGDTDVATVASYRNLARRMLTRTEHSQARAVPTSELPAYMGNLFQDILQMLCADAEGANAVDSAFVIAQCVVLARTAGILAAQLQLTDDPLRQVIEALMDGYTVENGGRQAPAHHHHHDHDHDHDHSHDAHDHRG